MLNWFKFFNKSAEQESEWEYAEEPIYEKEHRETLAIIEDLLVRLDEIKTLVHEIKDKDYD